MSGLRRVLLASTAILVLGAQVSPAAAQKQQHEQHPETEVVPGRDDPVTIPLGWLLISYGIAAAIGAAGGAIYVDVVGPLDRKRRGPPDRSIL